MSRRTAFTDRAACCLRAQVAFIPFRCVLCILYGSGAHLIPLKLTREDPNYRAQFPAAMGAFLDTSLYITRAEAQGEIGRLVAEQLDAFSAQR